MILLQSSRLLAHILSFLAVISPETWGEKHQVVHEGLWFDVACYFLSIS
jgi:hypothetical protein